MSKIQNVFKVLARAVKDRARGIARELLIEDLEELSAFRALVSLDGNGLESGPGPVPRSVLLDIESTVHGGTTFAQCRGCQGYSDDHTSAEGLMGAFDRDGPSLAADLDEDGLCPACVEEGEAAAELMRTARWFHEEDCGVFKKESPLLWKTADCSCGRWVEEEPPDDPFEAARSSSWANRSHLDPFAPQELKGQEPAEEPAKKQEVHHPACSIYERSRNPGLEVSNCDCGLWAEAQKSVDLPEGLPAERPSPGPNLTRVVRQMVPGAATGSTGSLAAPQEPAFVPTMFWKEGADLSDGECHWFAPTLTRDYYCTKEAGHDGDHDNDEIGAAPQPESSYAPPTGRGEPSEDWPDGRPEGIKGRIHGTRERRPLEPCPSSSPGWACSQGRHHGGPCVAVAVDDAGAAKQCEDPPEGWSCSRSAGHEGPCAASPIEPVEPTNSAWQELKKVLAEVGFRPVDCSHLCDTKLREGFCKRDKAHDGPCSPYVLDDYPGIDDCRHVVADREGKLHRCTRGIGHRGGCARGGDGVCDPPKVRLCGQCLKADCRASMSGAPLVHCAYCWELVEEEDLSGDSKVWCPSCAKREEANKERLSSMEVRGVTTVQLPPTCDAQDEWGNECVYMAGHHGEHRFPKPTVNQNEEAADLRAGVASLIEQHHVISDAEIKAVLVSDLIVMLASIGSQPDRAPEQRKGWCSYVFKRSATLCVRANAHSGWHWETTRKPKAGEVCEICRGPIEGTRIHLKRCRSCSGNNQP